MSRPVLSLLLEPRSLVITTGALYTDHLHGISDLTEDVLLPARQADEVTASLDRDWDDASGVQIANRHMLSDEKIRKATEIGGILQRGTRISLTCRDVEQVIGMKSMR